MIYTTLKKIRQFSPCEGGWKQLMTHLNKTKADDEKLDFKTILQAVGIKDTLWCLRTQDFKDYYKFIVRVAYSVLPIYENKYPDDNRPRLAIEAVEKFIKGEISKEELKEARAADADAAWNATAAAASLAAAAADAARASWTAADADAAWAAAAADAARATAWSAWAAADAAWTADAAWAADAAWSALAADAGRDTAWSAWGTAEYEKLKEIEQIFIEECLN